MKSVWTQIVATILGGFLAAGAGWFVDWKRESRRLENIQSLAITALQDDLKYSIGLYDKLTEDYNKTSIIWFAIINTIQESRQFYQKNKEWLVIFDDKELREKIFQYYIQSDLFLKKLENMEKRKGEIEKRLFEKINQFKIEHPTWKEDAIRKTALASMNDEVKEHDNLVKKIIPDSVLEIRDYRSNASGLINSINNYKNKK